MKRRGPPRSFHPSSFRLHPHYFPSQPTGWAHACFICPLYDGLSAGLLDVTTARTYSSRPVSVYAAFVPVMVAKTTPTLSDVSGFGSPAAKLAGVPTNW